ncbi:MAG: UDP-N-acetylmuramate dehydrogenase [Pseudomonadota bacterium]
MMAASKHSALADRLPDVRGRYSFGVALSKTTWFRAGGPAEVVFKPADEEDLATFLQNRPADTPVTVIGVGSNLLIRDGGIPGVVIRMGRDLARVTVDGETVVAGAGALDLNVAKTASQAGLAGLEFLVGVPGTIGGALRMNAGAYERELSDALIHARAIDPRGEVQVLTPEHLGHSYRFCSLPEGWVFTQAVLKGEPGDAPAIEQRMAEIQTQRSSTQPVRSRTGGSTFKNTPDAKAWELIDRAGCRGLTRGAAMVSEQHCNFLINTGGATAADLEGLGEEVRRRVFEKTGVRLEWEIRRIGRHATGPEEVA